MRTKKEEKIETENESEGLLKRFLQITKINDKVKEGRDKNSHIIVKMKGYVSRSMFLSAHQPACLLVCISLPLSVMFLVCPSISQLSSKDINRKTYVLSDNF